MKLSLFANFEKSFFSSKISGYTVTVHIHTCAVSIKHRCSQSVLPLVLIGMLSLLVVSDAG